MKFKSFKKMKCKKHKEKENCKAYRTLGGCMMTDINGKIFWKCPNIIEEEVDKDKEPTEVNFKTKDGNEVSFKATKIERGKNDKK